MSFAQNKLHLNLLNFRLIIQIQIISISVINIYQDTLEK